MKIWRRLYWSSWWFWTNVWIFVFVWVHCRVSVNHGGRVSWEDTRPCLDTKTNAIQRVLRIVSQNLKQNTKQSDNVVNPCPLFQSLSCNLPAEHATEGITYTHCCAYCMRRFNNRSTHAAMNCRKKQEADNRRTKNAKRRRRPQRE